MSIPTMGPNSDFKQWKRNFLTFLSLKATYLIPQPTIHESCVWLDEHAQHYAYALLLHAADENKRTDHAMKCVPAACPNCATTT
jgi:predicted Zn-ribbon and HTH transcriptional regulator